MDMGENDGVRLLKVTFRNGETKKFKEGTKLSEIVESYTKKNKSIVVAAKFNNDIRELGYNLKEDGKIDFIDLSKDDGLRIYQRSLCFLLIKAVLSLFPERRVIISHSISKGLYCEILGRDNITPSHVAKIKEKMKEYVQKDLPFVKREVSLEDAKVIFEKNSNINKYRALAGRDKTHVTIYNCDGTEDYFYGYMVISTRYLKKFDLKFYKQGVILLCPHKTEPNKIPRFIEQRKLFSIFKEFKDWLKILEVNNVASLNQLVKEGYVGELIRISEAFHEKKIAQIADMITNSKTKKSVILIAGPSSSGKTTFANRLSIQLKVNGIKPVTVNLDDYFVNRDDTPKDEKGDYDFESLEALDIPLFNDQLKRLIAGEEVEIPVFNFESGTREKNGKKLKISENQIIIIEGIHGINEKLTASIPKGKKFKIYVSALTSLNIDDHNRIPTTDTRILRRIVRDNQFRGCNALNTIKRWESVRRGEEINIFPYQENADVMFNSSLVFELGVLRTFAEPLLNDIDPNDPYYPEVKRLIEFLRYFTNISMEQIPSNSIIREFIGGSCFY